MIAIITLCLVAPALIIAGYCLVSDAIARGSDWRFFAGLVCTAIASILIAYIIQWGLDKQIDTITRCYSGGVMIYEGAKPVDSTADCVTLARGEE